MVRGTAGDGVNASEGSTGDGTGVRKASNDPAETATATATAGDVPAKRVWNRHARTSRIQTAESTANAMDENTT